MASLNGMWQISSQVGHSLERSDDWYTAGYLECIIHRAGYSQLFSLQTYDGCTTECAALMFVTLLIELIELPVHYDAKRGDMHVLFKSFGIIPACSCCVLKPCRWFLHQPHTLHLPFQDCTVPPGPNKLQPDPAWCQCTSKCEFE